MFNPFFRSLLIPPVKTSENQSVHNAGPVFPNMSNAMYNMGIMRNICELQYVTMQKLKFSINDFFSKYEQIRWKLRICSHLLNKSELLNKKNYFFSVWKNSQGKCKELFRQLYCRTIVKGCFCTSQVFY